MPSSNNLHTSSNLFSSGDESNHGSRETQRARAANAALTRMQNHMLHPGEEASSQETPDDQLTGVPPAVTQEEASPPSTEVLNESNESVVTRLDFENTAASTDDDENQSPTGTRNEIENLPYTEEERRMDNQVESEYIDAITQDFATVDPVEFAGHLYERQSIEAYLQSVGLMFTDSTYYSTDGVTTIQDPFSGSIVTLNFELRRPYTEVHHRYTRTLRQEVHDYQARSERREQYKSDE